MNQSLVFNDIKVNKKDFYASKQAILLNLVDVNDINISKRVKNNNDTSKYFIGHNDEDKIRPLYIILSQMSGYIKYFENGSKSMLFKIKDEDVYLKYNEIWNKIKSILNVKLHSQPIYDEKYIKTKVKTFSSDEISKEKNHYVCIPAVCIDSVLRVDKKNYPQIYLEQCKYKIKKRELVSLIDNEVDLSSNNSDDSDYLDE